MKEFVIKSKITDGKKEIKYKIFKNSPSIPTVEHLKKINQFTRRTFNADELYVGQLRLAHNAIDRDNERFSEFTLQGFADTAVRKTLLFDHNRNIKDNAIGKYFDVEIEKMLLPQAISELGEELKLPEGMTEVMIVSPWFYIPRAGVDEKDIIKLDAGIFDFASIGFNSGEYIRIADDKDNTLYYEYRGEGETREGSLVYLGTQQGMAVKTADPPAKAGSDKLPHNDIDNKSEGGKTKMKEFTKKLSEKLGKAISEDNAFDDIMAVVSDKDTRIKELEPKALDGESYRKSLVDDTVRFGVMIDEIPAGEEAQKSEAAFYMGLPIERLKTMKDKFEKRAHEAFPSDPTFKGKDETDRQQKNTEGKTQKSGAESPLAKEAHQRAETQKK